MIAYSSPFIPVEWIAAHGLRPHWLRPRSASSRLVLAVTRGICPYSGALLDTLFSEADNSEPGPFSACSALALTTICDQMRYAAALAESGGRCPVFLLNVPSTWQTVEVRELYLDELRRFGRFMQRIGGAPPTDDELARVMLAYERARQKLQSMRANLSARRFADALAELRGSLTALAEPPAGSPRTEGIPLAVIGGPLLEDDYTFYDVLENAGGRVVLDATEGGERTLPKKFDPEKTAADPLQELAESYFTTIPDVFRRPNTGLYEWLEGKLAERRVRGIVFRRYVWCDLWHGELQRLKQWSPVPVLEIDAGADDLSAANRIQSRIESFLEMLA
jgi:benzoyl-CoA reductase/2-hydroxyglutaryl-CoA dehydratase subunit BcrC/BadD/HgdB